MCGIAGLVATRNVLNIAATMSKMNDLVRHRGPDGTGSFVDGRVGLGHRRLSILDLSAAGHQPMVYDNGNYVLTYNGEVYNYIELRKELRELGFSFVSNTDSEVILAAYAAWGSACLEKFNGMWAFAIYDVKAKKLFAARDRFGIKPFYYIRTDYCFAFGSEIRQLVPLLRKASANQKMVDEFIITSMHDHEDETFFQGISRLPAGHYLIYDLSRDKPIITRFYDLAQRVRRMESVSDSERVDKFRGTFEDAVKLRLRSDVCVGSCLSGGLDSSSIAWVAARALSGHTNQPFSAVTAISEDPSMSEETHAKAVVRKAQLKWISTCPTYTDFVEILPQIVVQQEEPFASPSILMQAFVMRAARENGITVLLDGQGGDELLLGYPRYFPPYFLGTFRERGITAMLKAVWHSTRNNQDMSGGQWFRYTLWSSIPKLRCWYYARRIGDFSCLRSMPDWLQRLGAARADAQALQILDIEKTGLPALLRFEDKSSMKFAIEARLPFLDYRLVEQSIAMPLSLKIRDGWTKWVLRHVMNDALPESVTWRRDKVAFAAPENLWFRRHLDTMSKAIAGSMLLRRLAGHSTLLNRYPSLDRRTQWRLYSVALWEELLGIAA